MGASFSSRAKPGKEPVDPLVLEPALFHIHEQLVVVGPADACREPDPAGEGAAKEEDQLASATSVESASAVAAEEVIFVLEPTDACPPLAVPSAHAPDGTPMPDPTALQPDLVAPMSEDVVAMDGTPAPEPTALQSYVVAPMSEEVVAMDGTPAPEPTAQPDVVPPMSEEVVAMDGTPVPDPTALQPDAISEEVDGTPMPDPIALQSYVVSPVSGEMVATDGTPVPDPLPPAVVASMSEEAVAQLEATLEYVSVLSKLDKHGRLVHESGAPAAGDGCSFRLGPVDHGCCFITLEQNPKLKLVRLRVDGRKYAFTDQTLADALTTMGQIVETREPVTVTYDLRTICIPNMKQLRLGIGWCGENKENLDESIQGITVVMSSWVVAKMCNFVLAALRPPQPILICRSDREAVDFLAANCQQARSWAPTPKKQSKSSSAAEARAALAQQRCAPNEPVPVSPAGVVAAA